MSAPLRVDFTRRAYGELTAHAKESLEAEVGGVLVGTTGEDEDGAFVDVRATIRGSAAREARAQVTFTHETWNQIHTTLDRDFPDLQIVGWYHTHPGFGVEFSAMDRFIQENFFSGKTQVAFLTDPLGGDVSLARNGEGGLEYLPRFSVDGREHTARVPLSAAAAMPAAAGAGGGAGAGAEVRAEIERLEVRVGQLIRALDEQRTLFHRTMLAILVVVCGAIIGWVGYLVWADRYERIKPPESMSFVPVPVKIGDETVMLGVQVVRWDVPERLNALYDSVIRADLEERLRLIEEALSEQQREMLRRPPQGPPQRGPQRQQPQQQRPR
jgi:proteasome lid subunit RPN8/RPN11